ncbi:MAG: glycosyltransferase [Chitinivibrionales bacterium]|nr:glycosyltransferase [Chitinivibrionales bacterium]
MPRKPHLSIIIASWRRSAILQQTLRRLEKQLSDETELIIVKQDRDNVDTASAHVRVIRQFEANLPLARNRGIRHAVGEILLFVDDDIIPDENLAAAHLEQHQALPDVHAVVGRVVDANNPGTRPALVAFDQPTLTYVCDWGHDGECEVAGLMGCHMSFKRATFRRVLFDPWFCGNAHFEEVDLALRMGRRGMTIRFCGTIKVEHLLSPGGGCRAESSHVKYYYHHFRNRALCFAKNIDLRHTCSFVTKHKNDLEYFSRKGFARRNFAVVRSGIYGLASGYCAGILRRHVGPARYA